MQASGSHSRGQFIPIVRRGAWIVSIGLGACLSMLPPVIQSFAQSATRSGTIDPTRPTSSEAKLPHKKLTAQESESLLRRKQERQERMAEEAQRRFEEEEEAARKRRRH